MATKKKGFRLLATGILASAVGYGVYYCWVSFPIISGYGAKVLCSSVFVAGRTEQQVRKEDIASFPLNLGHFTVDYKDSSVTGAVWALPEKKAIDRSGLAVPLVRPWTNQPRQD